MEIPHDTEIQKLILLNESHRFKNVLWSLNDVCVPNEIFFFPLDSVKVTRNLYLQQ
jgi:hypothetical protein